MRWIAPVVHHTSRRILGMGRRWKGLVVKGAERKRKEDEREKGAGGGMGFRGSFLSLVLGGIDSHVIAIF